MSSVLIPSRRGGEGWAKSRGTVGPLSGGFCSVQLHFLLFRPKSWQKAFALAILLPFVFLLSMYGNCGTVWGVPRYVFVFPYCSSTFDLQYLKPQGNHGDFHRFWYLRQQKEPGTQTSRIDCAALLCISVSGLCCDLVDVFAKHTSEMTSPTPAEGWLPLFVLWCAKPLSR